MPDWKLLFNADGTANDALADALVDAGSMLPTGLGVIKEGSEERKKVSRMAAMVLLAKLDQARIKQAEKDLQMFQAASRGQNNGRGRSF